MDDQIRVSERDLFEAIGRLNVANQLLQQRLAAVVAENAALRQQLAERAGQQANGHGEHEPAAVDSGRVAA